MRVTQCLLFLAAVMLTSAHATVADETNLKPIRIVLVGDSTVASYANPPKDKPDLTGWGQVFGEFFADRVTVLNHAQSGRSTRSFIQEGLWKKALADQGDYIFIQFGHNDSHLKDGKPAVDPATDFQSYLRQYIDQARAAGAKPVLVTPVARRTFVDGKIVTGLQPYADAMFKVSKEKDVPVIDLHAAAMELFDRLGDQGSADLTAAAGDRTHFSRKGALAIARLVAEAVPVAVPELKPCLKKKNLTPTTKDAVASQGKGGNATPAASPAEKLPADGIYPRGRKLAFMGYSGDPARDLANGFTVAGPVYGDQMPYLTRCFQNGWPVVAHIGPHITFNDKDPAKYKLDPFSLRQEVEKQVRELAVHKGIVWWAIHPEELRPWRRDEMQYLTIVSDTIRKNDPQARPVYLYNPNHRDASSLVPIAKQVDILAKGSYVNSVGRKHDRAWVRWSVEQEIEAIRAAGRPNVVPLLMPELCKDPEPEEDKEIRAWVRHDVYLGMASGAKGVLIWSLFKRKEVKRTWQLWYDAYSECARELNGPRGLAQVFLFGQRRSTLKIKQVHGQAAARVTLGGNAEPTTTSNQERAQREVKLPSWTSAEFTDGISQWLFVVNSASAPAVFGVSDLPEGSRAENAFSGEAIQIEHGSPLQLDLPAYGVAGVRFR